VMFDILNVGFYAITLYNIHVSYTYISKNDNFNPV
jgi:hypothetical protein